MKQIYLAISSDAEYLISELKEADKIKEYTYKVLDKKEVKQALKEDFFLLIVDQEHLDEKIVSTIKRVNKATFKLWYINPTYKNEITSHISTFADLDSLIQSIQLSELTSSSLFHNLTSEGVKENSIKNEEINTEEKLNPEKELNELDVSERQHKSGRHSTPIEKNKEKNPAQLGITTQEADDTEKTEVDNGRGTNQLEDESKKASFVKRAAVIRKDLFSEMKWSQNKTIGVWSPLHRIGTSTFIINFAIYLGRMKVNTTVIESLTKYQILNTTLTRYTSKPLNWSSYIEALHDSTVQGKQVNWEYEKVTWFPLGKIDKDIEWEDFMIDELFKNVKYFDIALVDFPGGKMEDYTLYTLNHVQELWILVDDSVHQIVAWKNYIHQLQEEYDIDIKLIFIRAFPFSKSKKLAEDLEIHLFETIPDLSQAAAKNHYMKYPLLDYKNVYDLLQDPFETLGKHLVEELKTNKPTVRRLLSKFRSIF
ncbi:hypothetical protein [Metabacillus halosaccharovorans]|uniref:hypothetical protein n=1 Tax=Metabacillus halosaccharovorans TaxID=930124 RepID=UPI001C1FD5E1|nr:hypothetical protein [Metabacillus halosaccharovorans]MBU7595915.1 hypothetical protein [Metabacillus halosaccharovorans]